MEVAPSASSTASSSSGDHWRNQRWCGMAPPATRSATVMPVGRDRLLGQDAQALRDLAGRQAWMSWPSRSTDPAFGVSRRARARSRVDLPQALAPTITVTLPVGDLQREVVDDDAVVVGEARRRRQRRAVGCAVWHRSSSGFRSGWPGRGARAGRARR